MTGDWTAGVAPPLYGRSSQRHAVAALLDRVRASGADRPRTGRPTPGRAPGTDGPDRRRADVRVLVVTGERGCGRTALLEYAALRFDAGPVLRVPGGAPRPHGPYGIRQAVSEAAARAGCPSAEGPDTATVPDALLHTLRAAARRAPVLVCADDAHLWDPASRAALGQVARHLHTAGPVGLILAVAGPRSVDRDLTGLPVVHVGPLSRARSAALLYDLVGPSVDPAVRDALLDEAEGNPALLTALARRLSAAELCGRRPLPRPLADADLLASMVGGIPGGPAPGADALQLTVAAALREPEQPDADADVVLRAVARLRGGADIGPPPQTLLWADGRVRFADTLTRRAVYAAADPERRRAAHRALAAVLAGDGRRLLGLLHRAWSATGPAPRTATALADAAEAGVSGPHRLRSAAYARAAELTTDERTRAERYTAAAEQASCAGRPHQALRLVAAARGGAAPAAVHGRAELVRGATLLRDGPVADARESFLLAASLLDADLPALATAAVLAAADAAWAAGDVTGCRRVLDSAASARVRAPGRGDPDDGHRAVPRAMVPRPTVFCDAARDDPAPGAGPRPRSVRAPGGHGSHAAEPTAPHRDPVHDYRLGMRAALDGHFDRAAPSLTRVLESAAGPAHDPVSPLRAAAAALLLGEVEEAGRAATRALVAARARGHAAMVPQALEYLAYAELRAGRHAQARAHAEEGLRAAERTEQRNAAAHHHAVLALAASIEGEEAAVSHHVRAALATARRHGLAQAATLAQWAAARADLGRGRPLEAADRLGPLVRPGPRRGHFAVWMLAVPCFVEAAALSGRPEQARAVVEDFARWAACGADPQAPAQLLRCRALLAPVDRADSLYLTALALHDEAGGEFEAGRTELSYGKWLRRRRRPREARTRLGSALVAFERCGARAWADQTEAELRANGAAAKGVTARGTAGAGAGACPELAGLTPQQLRIVRYVAEGATNREVARSMSVSPRTVDYHLRNVFATLGIRSRVELALLVEQAEKTGAPL
ncbi:helix-turn-helix transcriptional regulator [Streptomyces sp. S465]|uniref:helix-turn-helix transcriptional regulator n=1 Tax=Streptomyces sp. S465 TaxID=2979468 RepID=UPI0022A850BE|nr:LuxR family transcriptional regulator [Streptomyces sp. S465]WAP53751.1 LuxR family transcriptional regulator [Streptomyces sp. S465]